MKKVKVLKVVAMPLPKKMAEGNITNMLKPVGKHLAKIMVHVSSDETDKNWEDEISHNYLFSIVDDATNVASGKGNKLDKNILLGLFQHEFRVDKIKGNIKWVYTQIDYKPMNKVASLPQQLNRIEEIQHAFYGVLPQCCKLILATTDISDTSDKVASILVEVAKGLRKLSP